MSLCPTPAAHCVTKLGVKINCVTWSSIHSVYVIFYHPRQYHELNCGGGKWRRENFLIDLLFKWISSAVSCSCSPPLYSGSSVSLPKAAVPAPAPATNRMTTKRPRIRKIDEIHRLIYCSRSPTRDTRGIPIYILYMALKVHIATMGIIKMDVTGHSHHQHRRRIKGGYILWFRWMREGLTECELVDCGRNVEHLFDYLL